ncbi:MAG: tyrosine-type recombinase/integrase [Streptococcus hyointestinalis]|nr:site-specific integrase [Streptococcus hyointestinalis]MDD6384652.1 tyrosine-type recombinase/integrase [Streptococcus hyointestinalis]
MWHEKQANGNYKFIEYYKDPYTGKKKRAYVTLDRLTKQSETKARRMLNEIISERIRTTGDTTIQFHELVDEWEASHSKEVKPRTMRVYQHPITKIKDFIGEDVLVKNIDTRLLQAFIDDLRGKYADNTVNLIKQPLNMILKYAVRMEYIKVNPMDNVVTPKRKSLSKKQLEETYLETEQYQSIIKVLRDPIYGNHIANFVETIFLTGMRPGELLALMWEDIDFDNLKIKIAHTLDYSTNGHAQATVGSVKNDGSYRTIDMPSRVRDIFIEEQNYQRMNDLDNPFIFISKKGNHLSINTINRKIKKTSQKLYGIIVTSHGFRHGHITLLAELGIPLKAIMDRVGHTDVNTTIKIYTHVTEKLGRQLVDKLNNLVPI